ncbi:synaptophysin-like protein 1 [Platysternon megacephalum]|uniref:Synaptophysin-like protein 1 n=1 Tax=Platysternon megacephalum TaxID=55544 RepID=A0A4D9DKK6_9SAUR|nr:synaptophysin-like protein 1 [Platysternon megacephalum]
MFQRVVRTQSAAPSPGLAPSRHLLLTGVGTAQNLRGPCLDHAYRSCLSFINPARRSWDCLLPPATDNRQRTEQTQSPGICSNVPTMELVGSLRMPLAGGPTGPWEFQGDCASERGVRLERGVGQGAREIGDRCTLRTSLREREPWKRGTAMCSRGWRRRRLRAALLGPGRRCAAWGAGGAERSERRRLQPWRPSRSHSTMSLSVRPQRRALAARINRSQSFAGVNSTQDKAFR